MVGAVEGDMVEGLLLEDQAEAVTVIGKAVEVKVVLDIADLDLAVEIEIQDEERIVLEEEDFLRLMLDSFS